MREAGFTEFDAITPFPVHGLPEALHVPRTRLAICAFIFGLTGLSLGLLMVWYMMIHDWAQDVGGKPNWTLYHNIPAFIPPLFEGTVFCAAHLMFWTLLFRSWLFPGVTPKNPDPRTTDDKFLMLIETNDTDKVSQLLKASGATEIKIV